MWKHFLKQSQGAACAIYDADSIFPISAIAQWLSSWSSWLQKKTCFQFIEDVGATAPGNDFSSLRSVIFLTFQFGQQFLQGVPLPGHHNITRSQTGSRAEIIPAVPHVKYPLVLHASTRLIRQIQLQHLFLTHVDGASIAVVRVVALYLHVPELIEFSRVGENLIDSCLESRCVEDPVYEHGVGVRDDYAVDGAFILRYECQQVCHPSCEGDGLHHAADPVWADLLVSWMDRWKKKKRSEVWRISRLEVAIKY